jgi:hypothetical protein
VLPALRDHILPLVPGLIERLEAGIRVLDVGRGRAFSVVGGERLSRRPGWSR